MIFRIKAFVKGYTTFIGSMLTVMILVLTPACEDVCDCDNEPEEEESNSPCEDKDVPEDKRVIHFSGMCWVVANDNGSPGCNYYSDSEANVWKDEFGNLHLKIRQDNEGNWQCASLETVETKGHGTYTFDVKTNLNQLDKNTVLGLFFYGKKKSWDSYPKNFASEIDIEVTRWGEDKADNIINYYAYNTTNRFDKNMKGLDHPVKKPGNEQRFTFKWTPDSIHYKANNGIRDYAQKTCKDTDDDCWDWQYGQRKTEVHNPQGVEKLHMNFWLYDKDDSDDDKENELCSSKGLGDPPSDGQPQEVVIKSVNYTPYN